VRGRLLRVGYVQQRDDWLAEKCMEALFAWDGGKDLAHAHTIDISPDSTAGREFVDRLEPATRTAQYMILDPGKEATAMVDPVADAPVVVSENGSITALAPNRLPATAPLAELILEEPIWIRTEDGLLFPVPRNAYFGLSWGYSGSGPSARAALAAQLLDDVTSAGAQLRGNGDETRSGGISTTSQSR
jgi:hypothetical protein